MAISNKDRISRTLDLLRDGLVPFVERELKARLGSSWLKVVNDSLRENLRQRADGTVGWDTQGLFTVMEKWWGDVFRFPLGRMERSYVNEMRETRNDFAHEKTFTYDDTERALDTAQRLLRAVSAGQQAEAIERLRVDLKRTIYDEQRRQQVRRQSPLTLEGTPKAGLRPWREVITPHEDVATGRYSEAEFAADLAQVDHGTASAEYADPVEFYRRTFLTDGLRKLLAGAIRRLSQRGGDPAVDLQTNFGGGKTHSMLALYHMAGAAEPGSLPGLDQLLAEVGVQGLPQIHRAVLVGTALSPGEPTEHEDGVATRPHQPDPQRPPIDWAINRVGGQDPIAKRAGKRFESDEALLTQLGPGRLRKALDQFDLWRGQNHAEIKQVLADFATYLYLPRLRDRQLVIEAVRSAIGQLVIDHFAYAEGFDPAAQRYTGLARPSRGDTIIDPTGLLIEAEAASEQLGTEVKDRPEHPPSKPPISPRLATRFFGSAAVDPLRAGRDAGRIAEEVLQHLATQAGADVHVTLEIQARLLQGIPESLQRVLDENCRALKFREHGFGQGER